MKDEEMAEEYKESRRLHDIPKERHLMVSQEERLNELKQAFLAGLKAGRPQWHYVKDGIFPKEKGNYLVAWERTHHVEEYGKWGFDVDLFNVDEGYFEGVGDYVIAWCEIPTFDKEIE